MLPELGPEGVDGVFGALFDDGLYVTVTDVSLGFPEVSVALA